MKNIFSILKKVFILSLIIIFYQVGALALDEKYDWASGYKIRSSDSMDSVNYFKNQVISGGGLQNNVNLLSTWPVTQEKTGPRSWNATYPQCRTQTNNLPACTAACVATVCNADINFNYTCSGDVSYDLQISQDANNLVGGDTMYGAWSMLFSYFPPVLDSKSCSQFGRCFVGNAFILDTKAQKEESVGRLWGLGVKELVEGPGDVFYFDQVRAMTQPPKDTGSGFNNPYLVGGPVSGVVCNDLIALLDNFGVGNASCGLCNIDIGPLATRILTAAAEAFQVPAANIWAAMLHEGGDWPEYWGPGHIPTDEEILKWSLPETCGGEPMPRCDNSNPAAQPPYGHLLYWFYKDAGADSIWSAVQVIDPSKDTPDKVSRCNFLDATFAAAKVLREGVAMYAGTTCDGYTFDPTSPPGCNWSNLKVAQSQRSYMGSCGVGGPAYRLPFIVSNFNKSKCY